MFEAVLDRNLETALDRPGLVALEQGVGGLAGVAPELLQGGVERGEMPAKERGVEGARAHRPNSPRSTRRRTMASSLASCGR